MHMFTELSNARAIALPQATVDHTLASGSSLFLLILVLGQEGNQDNPG